ncbi:hypothetical protein HYN48_01960 [Flavobacterium magnum]|uniref:Secretion system C-terminal sorting domain-containing protein n=1 Tax=Flavobacterium magnum TaxID=2162713 RepID=A0A2S0RBC9_9FLAO|nr:T9SS type A sorting domain-containing protein [Flavobacterium magnum]AWA28946.1 hypothetical protein HYN48_01960 [Flavobacterium magnum]
MKYFYLLLFSGLLVSAQDNSNNQQWGNKPYNSLSFTGPQGNLSGNLDNNQVFAIAEQPDGKILIGGGFYNFNELESPKVVRVNPDGTVDPTFLSTITKEYFTRVTNILVLADGRIVITGQFDGGIASYRILDSYGHVLDPGNLISGNLCNAALLQADGKILLSGEHNQNGYITKGITRLNNDGTLDTTFPTVGQNVGSVQAYQIRGFAQQSDGKVIVVGEFSGYRGAIVKNMFRMNTDGTLDTTFNNQSNINDEIHCVKVLPDDSILIGGDFYEFGGVTRNHFAKLHPDGTLDTGFPVDNTIYPVNSIDVQPDGKILLATDYSPNNTGFSTRLNPDGSVDTSFFKNSLVDGDANIVHVLSNGRIIFGGDFKTFQGAPRKYLVAVSENGILDAAFNPCTGANDEIRKMVKLPDGKILIAGKFEEFNGTTHFGVARILADGSVDPSFDCGTAFLNGTVNDLAISGDGKIIVGGIFSNVLNSGLNGVVRLHPDGTLDTSFQAPLASGQYATHIAIQADGKVLLSGEIYLGLSAYYRLNPDGSHDAAFDPNLSPYNTYSITVQPDQKIIYTGSFSYGTGESKHGVARVNPDGSIDTGFNVTSGANGNVYAASLYPNGKILFGGTSTNYNNTTVGCVFRVNANGSLDNTFVNQTAYAPVHSITQQSDGKIIITGAFSAVNGHPSKKVARLHANGSVDTQFLTTSANGFYAASSLLDDDGELIVAGDFTEYNGVHRGRINRVNMSTLETGAEVPGLDEKISVYPNPANATVTVSSSSAIEAISLYDIKGVLLKQFEAYGFEATIDISAYEASVYVLKIKSGHGLSSRKIVKL